MNITSINGISFSGVSGFGMLIDSQTTYYIIDRDNSRIIIFDKNWKYASTKSIPYPYSMITKNNYLYITSEYYIYKSDKFLNVIKTYNPSNNPSFRGICYNSNDNYIYTVSNNYNRIYSFDLDLNLIDSFNTSLTTSYYSNQINIYARNLTFTGKSFPTASYPRYIGFDSKNHLVVLSNYQLSIYVKNKTTNDNESLLSNPKDIDINRKFLLNIILSVLTSS